jgi:hypothetical protein
MEISYRRTNPSSLQSQSKAKSRLTVSYEAKATTGMPVQNRFPSYADLTWETIEEYLKPQFPTWTAYNAKHVSANNSVVLVLVVDDISVIQILTRSRQIGDSWVFELPKLLSNVSSGQRTYSRG